MSNKISLRPDLAVIAEYILPNSSVLDVGCGNGDLLAHLATEKQVKARGLELRRNLVNQAIADGLSVVQGDIDTDLPYYPDDAYDTVVCVKTLQATSHPRQVLGELARVGKRVIVSVPNFGSLRNRLYLGLKGRMPMSKKLSYHWYETPNIHFCTLTDMAELCDDMGLLIEQHIVLGRDGRARSVSPSSFSANLLGEEGIFILRKK